ncbi:MAG: helix-turn-helix domain-containing protein [Bacteriovoracia bacterium]
MRDRVRKHKSNSPFAQNLKSVLVDRGISQKAAAELADVPPSTVGDWLSGVNPTDALAVQRLCRALKCDFEWLLTGQKGRTDFSEIPLGEIFDVQDEPDFSGFFEITARRLKKKGQ